VNVTAVKTVIGCRQKHAASRAFRATAWLSCF